MQAMCLVKSVVTSCVGLTLSSLIETSTLGVVCFMHLWNCGLCLHALVILLLELTAWSCGLDLDCFRIVVLSLAHRAQFLVAKVLTTLMGLPCQTMLQVIPSHWLVRDRFVSFDCVSKWLVDESDFLPSLTSFGTSMKWCTILLNFCWVFPMHAFPVLLHLTLWTAVEFLYMSLQPQMSAPPVL